MAITASTAKPIFNIGSFNLETGLTIPNSNLKNKITFDFTELVSEATPSPSFDPFGTTANIFALLSVSFEGDLIYQNTQFSATSGASLTDPDITIAVSGWDANPVEVVTINNPVTMILDSDGNAASGSYSISIKYFWQYDGGGEWAAFQMNYPSISFSFNPTYPTLYYWYDTGVPELNLLDKTTYEINGVTPTRDIEFILYPPKNKAEITTETTDIQDVKYSTFWTGGNEFQYTSLLTYEFSDKIYINLQQAYKDFNIFNIDRCAIFNCLNDLYERYNSASCGTKQKAVTQQILIEATALATQIITGSGCGEDSFSELIEQFNALCECECSYNNNPVQIGASNIVLQNDIQSIAATAAETSVDLSAGSTVFVNLAVNDGTTEIQAINITQYANYRFIFTRAFSVQEATFESGVFFDAEGDVAEATPTSGNKVILDFFATTNSTLTLVSRNDVY